MAFQLVLCYRDVLDHEHRRLDEGHDHRSFAVLTALGILRLGDDRVRGEKRTTATTAPIRPIRTKCVDITSNLRRLAAWLR